MKIGVLGGTFDPPHLGHIKLAERAKKQLNLGRVLFIPAGQPWMKTGISVTPAHHRLSMVQLAIDGNPSFEVSDLEIKRMGPSYSIDTLENLAKTRGPVEMTFIMGEDALEDLHRWHEVDRFLGMCDLAFYRRGKREAVEDERVVVDSVELGQLAIPLEGPSIEISSSDIRRRSALRLSLVNLVHPSVETYIDQHRLYVSK
jgi:nicotinate-nucleotide adenylyltransferase